VRRPVGALWAALAGLALTVAASLGALDGAVSDAEQAVFRWINELPDWLERPMWALQLLGVLVTPIAVAAVALVLRQWRLALALVLLAPLKLVVERQVLKALVERQRPGQNEPGAILRDVPPAGLSFPSGHAIIAVGIATLLWPYLGRGGRIAVVVLALAVGVARVYLGAHNPLDVVAGAGLGLLLGGLLTLLVGVPVRRPRER
jgi:membrane-associated phospholipid phosphatase